MHQCAREREEGADGEKEACGRLSLRGVVPSSPLCAVGRARRVCLAELIKTVNRSAHLKGERERAGAGKVK